MTPKQEQLKQIHGTPEEFRAALTRALGDISIDEANAALARYQADWDAAGASDQEATSAPPLTEADIQWKRFEKLYRVKYKYWPYDGEASTRTALAWFKAGLAYTSTIMGVRAMMEKMTALERDAFVNWVAEQGRQLRGASRNGGTRPSMKDFVFIEDGVPFRVSKLGSGWWIMVWHADKKWVFSRTFHETDVHFYYEKAIPLEQARLYEAGVPFEPAEASATLQEPPAGDQPASEGT